MSDLFGALPDEIEDLAAEEAALVEALTAEGVTMCSNCGQRPPRPSKGTGRKPTTCQVCAAKKGRGGNRDKAPASVKIQLGSGRSPRKDSDAALVEARAKQIALMLATGLTLAGAKDDAAILADGAAAWSKAVAGLAPYEPWLVEMCKGGGEAISGRVMAWATVGVASAGLVLPVAINHQWMSPGPITSMFASVAELAAAQAAEDAADAAAAPAAA